MTLYDLWFHAPQCFVFIKSYNGKAFKSVLEYKGTSIGKKCEVDKVLATSYPMYKHVLEVDVHLTEGLYET